MAWSSTALTTPTVGSKLTATQGAVIAADLNVFLNPVSYTSTWTGSTTNPANVGSYQGTYIQAGKWCFAEAVIGIGGTTTMGSGTYLFALPVTASSSLQQGSPIGLYTFKHGGASLTRVLVLSSSTTAAAVDSAGTAVSATVPAAPVNGDQLLLSLSYLTA